ncbi:MAG: hypothetical protein ABI604_10040 [Nitrospirota bacterium]
MIDESPACIAEEGILENELKLTPTVPVHLLRNSRSWLTTRSVADSMQWHGALTLVSAPHQFLASQAPKTIEKQLQNYGAKERVQPTHV